MTLYPDVLKKKTIIVVKPGRSSRRVARSGFVNNKEITFFQIFVSQQLLFSFSKHLDTMSNVTDCDPVQTDLCLVAKR